MKKTNSDLLIIMWATLIINLVQLKFSSELLLVGQQYGLYQVNVFLENVKLNIN